MPKNNWEMRRTDRKISEEESYLILDKCEYGILATVGEEGEPYAIPLSYTRKGASLYFHCAQNGRKIENISRDPRVCFTLVGDVKAAYQNGFTTLFESVVLEGQVHPVLDETEKWEALLDLAKRYLPEHIEKAPANIEALFARTAVYRIDIEKISGKAKR